MIDVYSLVNEAALPYNKIKNNLSNQNLEILKLEGYLVNDYKMINFPVLGEISIDDLTEDGLEKKNKLY